MKISRCCSLGLLVAGVVAGASEAPEDRGLLVTASVVTGPRGLIESTSELNLTYQCSSKLRLHRRVKQENALENITTPSQTYSWVG